MAFLALALACPLHAEDIHIPIGQQGAGRQVAAPPNGMSQHAVLARFGQPLQAHAAVGQPPITTWHYADFTVYFEGQRVIHAVIHPPAPDTDNQNPSDNKTTPDQTRNTGDSNLAEDNKP